jgi:hypothetical protein
MIPPDSTIPPPESSEFIDPSPLFFVEQIEDLGNACGTIGIIHAVANSVTAPSDLITGIRKIVYRRNIGYQLPIQILVT